MIRSLGKRVDRPTESGVSAEFSLTGVSRGEFRRIAACLPQYDLAYDPLGQSVSFPNSLLAGVSWNAYETILAATPRGRMRHTYDNGRLEMMSPSYDHEWLHKFIGRLLEAMTLELGIPICSVAHTTQRRRRMRKGLEPDESYYIQNEALMRGKRKYDPERDPPPDLAIEVDVFSSSLPRFPVYARLGLPEVWRYDGENLAFYHLAKTRRYRRVPHSVAIDWLTPADIERFIDRRGTTDENTLVREFIDWVRQRTAKTKRRKRG